MRPKRIWWATATPEEREARIAKMKAGRAVQLGELRTDTAIRKLGEALAAGPPLTPGQKALISGLLHSPDSGNA